MTNTIPEYGSAAFGGWLWSPARVPRTNQEGKWDLCSDSRREHPSASYSLGSIRVPWMGLHRIMPFVLPAECFQPTTIILAPCIWINTLSYSTTVQIATSFLYMSPVNIKKGIPCDAWYNDIRGDIMPYYSCVSQFTISSMHVEKHRAIQLNMVVGRSADSDQLELFIVEHSSESFTTVL